MSAIAIYSAEPLHVDGLRYVLQRYTRLQVAPTVQTIDELLQMVVHRQKELDLVLVDYTTGGLGTLKGLAAARGGREKPYVALWARDLTPEIAAQAVQLGCRGLVRQTLGSEVQARAIERIANGEMWWEKPLGDALILAHQQGRKVTTREAQIIALITAGLRNKEIAAQLGNTEGTVKVYISRLFQKLGVRGRTELAIWGSGNGYDQVGERPPRFIVPPGRAA